MGARKSFLESVFIGALSLATIVNAEAQTARRPRTQPLVPVIERVECGRVLETIPLTGRNNTATIQFNKNNPFEYFIPAVRDNQGYIIHGTTTPIARTQAPLRQVGSESRLYFNSTSHNQTLNLRTTIGTGRLSRRVIARPIFNQAPDIIHGCPASLGDKVFSHFHLNLRPVYHHIDGANEFIGRSVFEYGFNEATNNQAPLSITSLPLRLLEAKEAADFQNLQQNIESTNREVYHIQTANAEANVAAQRAATVHNRFSMTGAYRTGDKIMVLAELLTVRGNEGRENEMFEFSGSYNMPGDSTAGYRASSRLSERVGPLFLTFSAGLENTLGNRFSAGAGIKFKIGDSWFTDAGYNFILSDTAATGRPGHYEHEIRAGIRSFGKRVDLTANAAVRIGGLEEIQGRPRRTETLFNAQATWKLIPLIGVTGGVDQHQKSGWYAGVTFNF